MEEDGESTSKYIDVTEKMTLHPRPKEGEKKVKQVFGRREFQERTVTAKVLGRNTCDVCLRSVARFS